MTAPQVEKQPSARLRSDAERVLAEMNSSFNPLHQDFPLDFQMAGARNGYVYLSIALPEGMIRVFVSMLESLHGFFRFVDLKARVAALEGKLKRVGVLGFGREVFETAKETFWPYHDKGSAEKIDYRLNFAALFLGKFYLLIAPQK